jgi:hypothetical protein
MRPGHAEAGSVGWIGIVAVCCKGNLAIRVSLSSAGDPASAEREK